jgi:hypothetical protein
MDHRAIISQLGGIRALARKLDHPRHTTVQGWFDRNRIPLDRWPEILAAADADGIEVTTNDLLPPDVRLEAPEVIAPQNEKAA